jgi:hypothetical protein
MRKRAPTLSLVTALVIFAPRPGLADLLTPVIIDENGNGMADFISLSAFIGNDPGPGGLNNVLIYQLPYAGVQGDVAVTDTSPDCNGCTLDYIRFNGDGTLIFYSDNAPTFDSLADSPSPPGGSYLNQQTVLEIGPEDNNFALYTPLPGQPGYDGTFHPAYTFISDSATVPEAGTLALLFTAVVGLGILSARKKEFCGRTAD